MFELGMEVRLNGGNEYEAYNTQSMYGKTPECLDDKKALLQVLSKVTDTPYWRKVYELEKTYRHK